MNCRYKKIRRRSQCAMVLLEVVVALFIFTTVAFSLVIALNTSMDSAAKRNEIDAAVRGLDNRLSLLHVSRMFPVDKDLDKDSYGISYHLTVEPANLKDQNGQMVASMYHITILAKWKSGMQNEDRSIDELFYQP